MHVDQPPCACPFMQVIDILRHNHELARPLLIQPRERMMRHIGFRFLDIGASHIIEAENKFRITCEGFRCCHILDAVFFPQSACTTESIDSAFGRNAGACQDHDVAEKIMHGPALWCGARTDKPRLPFFNALGQCLSIDVKEWHMTAIGIIGSNGRMGQALVTATMEAGLDVAGGIDAGGDPIALARSADVLIDFSSPAALLSNIGAAVATGKPILIGTTGLTEDHHRAIDDAANHVAVLQTGNTSLGVTLLARLVQEAAAKLGPDWDIEIVEMHHRMKVDAPSGTALLLGEAAAKGRQIDLARHKESGRDGHTDAREVGAIGFAALRGGTVAGDHSVIFAADHERIELVHRAENRAIFARGAIRAAQWLVRQPAGRYTMDQVLGV